MTLLRADVAFVLWLVGGSWCIQINIDIKIKFKRFNGNIDVLCHPPPPSKWKIPTKLYDFEPFPHEYSIGMFYESESQSIYVLTTSDKKETHIIASINYGFNMHLRVNFDNFSSQYYHGLRITMVFFPFHHMFPESRVDNLH